MLDHSSCPEEEVNEESTLNDQLNITLREQEKCRHEIRRLNAEYAKEEDLLSNSIAGKYNTLFSQVFYNDVLQ